MGVKMRKLYDLLTSSFLARYVFLLTLLISVVTLFGNIDLSDFPKKIFFVKVGLVFFVPLLFNICFEILSRHVNMYSKDFGDILNILNHRFGSQISLRTLDERAFDYIHKYELIYRQDQLDFAGSLDYHSFRQLKGKNISKDISSFLIYTESSDIPIAFDDMNITAQNNISKKTLVVECLHSTNEKRLQHTFKINFDTPIAPNEEFDISYSITIPNELSVYDKKKEIQSISLVRIKHPVEKLVFNICLDFEPRAVKAYSRKNNNGLKEIGHAQISQYIPTTDLQKSYNISWGKNTPYIIETEVDNPSQDQYIIQFLK